MKRPGSGKDYCSICGKAMKRAYELTAISKSGVAIKHECCSIRCFRIATLIVANELIYEKNKPKTDDRLWMI